jgi:hypothetical protein
LARFIETGEYIDEIGMLIGKQPVPPLGVQRWERYASELQEKLDAALSATRASILGEVAVKYLESEPGRFKRWLEDELTARPEEQATVKTLDGEEPAILVAASYIKRLGGQQDWACVKCVPHSDMLVDGFTCYYHRALAALSPQRRPVE